MTASNASMEAARILARWPRVASQPVDVFGMVVAERVWLRTGPLGSRDFGFYIRHGDSAGIFLNANHPEPVQRFTCAHELGHHVLGHESHFDDHENFFGLEHSYDRGQEHEAQVFASNLLMPYDSVRVGLRTAGCPSPQTVAPTPVQVYRASVQLGVSFRALVWQLTILGYLSRRQAAEYLKNNAGLKAAKQQIAGASWSAALPEADIRFVELTDTMEMSCRVGDDLIVVLDEHVATGYGWEVAAHDEEEIELLSVESTAPQPDLDRFFIASTNRRFHLRTSEVGDVELSFELRRPWESRPIDSRTLSVVISPRRSLNGAHQEQSRRRLATLGR